MARKRTIQIIAFAAILLILIVLFFVKRMNTQAKLEEPVTAPVTATAPAGAGTADSATEAEITAMTAGTPAESAEPLFVESIDEEALRSCGLPVMIQFFSTTCVPCMSMMDDLRAFYSENYGKVKVVALNIEEYPEAAMSYPVSVVPTQLFLTASGENYIPSQRIIGSVGNFARYTYTATGELAYVVHQGVLTKSQMERITAEAGGM